MTPHFLKIYSAYTFPTIGPLASMPPDFCFDQVVSNYLEYMQATGPGAAPGQAQVTFVTRTQVQGPLAQGTILEMIFTTLLFRINRIVYLH